MVGPEDKINQTTLEVALSEAIEEGRLQALLKEDTQVKVLDLATLEALNDATAEPTGPQEEDIVSTGDNDSEQDAGAGTIAGVTVAACVAVGLAAIGLIYIRSRKNASSEHSNSLRKESSGVIANLGEPSDDEDIFLDDMEKGSTEHSTISASADNMHNMCMQTDEAGLETLKEKRSGLLSSVVTPATFFIRPNLRNSMQASDGDLGASDNHMDSIHSQGNGDDVGLMPVTYSTAMDLVDHISSDDATTSSSSSSSIESGSASDLSDDDSMSGSLSSSSSSSSEEDHLPFKREMRALASPVDESGQTLDSIASFQTNDNMRVAGDSKKMGLGAACAASKHRSLCAQSVPNEPSAANGSPIGSNDGPSAGFIAAVTVGGVGVVATGVAVIYAVTRNEDGDNQETRDETNPQVTEASDVQLPQLQSENGLDKAVAVCAAHVAAADVDVAGVESFRQSLVEKDSGWSGIAASVAAASFAVIHDHTVVDESESEDEVLSESGSEYSSERSDNHEVEAAVGLQPRSISLLDASSLTQYEDASVLCAHPRPPCPAEKGLSTGAAAAIGTGTGTPRPPSPTEEDISTGAAAAIGTGNHNGTAVTGVGAIAAFLAG